MDDQDNFPPELRRRASDPSLEEMLRRARDAPLNDGFDTSSQPVPHLMPLPARPPMWRQGGTPPGRAVFWIGVIVGALVMYVGIQVHPFGGNVSPQPPAAQYAPATAPPAPPTPTDVPLPTPTPTDMPTIRPGPTVPPPTTDEIVALAKQFYDNQSQFAGTYILVDYTALALQSQEIAQLTACLAYEYAFAASPAAVVGSDTRLFTLATTSDGTWQVVQIGDMDSCNLH